MASNQNSLKSIDFSWHEDKTIRADLIQNKDITRIFIKILLFLLLICYGSRMLPDAEIMFSETPEKWQRVNILEVHQVNPLNRKLKIYAAPANNNQEIDQIYQVQVYSLLDDNEKEKLLDVKVNDLDQFTDIQNEELKFYLGDIHILNQVAYRIKIYKPQKLGRLLQNETQNAQNMTILDNQTNQSQKINKQNEMMNITDLKQQNQTENSSQIDKQKEEKEQQTEEQRKRKQENMKKQKERKKQEQQEKIKKQKQEEEERKRNQAQEEEKRKQQEQKKKAEQEQAERMRKIRQYTNIKIEAHMKSDFATVLQLIVRYISVLMIIYIATDNSDAPLSIAVICAVMSNPLLFLHISYPNKLSNVIDCFCRSGHMLFFAVWLYYTHTKSFHTNQTRYKLNLGIKMAMSAALFLLQFIRLMHFQVWFLQALIAGIVIFFISLYLWDGYLNLQYQHHRDKVLSTVTLYFLGCLFTFKFLTQNWKDQMSFIIYQLYGFILIYLLASPKTKKISKKKQSAQQNKLSKEEPADPVSFQLKQSVQH